MKQVPFDRLAKSAKSNRNTTTTTGSDNHKSPQREQTKAFFLQIPSGTPFFVDGRQKLKGRGEWICHSIFGPLADTCITTCQIRMMDLLLYMYMRALSIMYVSAQTKDFASAPPPPPSPSPSSSLSSHGRRSVTDPRAPSLLLDLEESKKKKKKRKSPRYQQTTTTNMQKAPSPIFFLL